MEKYTYLFVNLGAVIIPFLFSFHPSLKFYKEWKFFFPSLIFGSGIFIIWDVLFTEWGIWRFNEKYVTGIYVFNLPLEELLFFICIPYACVFTYHCFGIFFNSRLNNSSRSLSFILSIVLLVLGIFYIDKSYTSVTFIFASLLILYLKIIRNNNWFTLFFLTWMILLLPFFIVNGILTGTGLDEPVVIYNNSENLGLRILTIPVEDFIYGMLLMLLIISGFEKRRSETISMFY